MLEELDKMVVGVTLKGKMKDNFNWLNWLNYCENKVLEYNYESNYIEFESESVKSKRILQLKRKNNRSRILNSINNNEEIEFLTVCSLPKNFIQAVFDYYMYIGINIKHKQIEMAIEKDLYLKVDINKTIQELKNFIILEEGEIFEISRKECPFSYARRWNDISYYKTLKILDTF